MAYKSYSERLKDPRWQKRRLEVLERAGWECNGCTADDKTLHVHHKIYRKGAQPWEYEDCELEVLCEGCHAENHRIRERLAAALARLPIYDVDRVLGYVEGLLVAGGFEPRTKLLNAEHVEGVSDAVQWHYWASQDVFEARDKDDTVTKEQLEAVARLRNSRVVYAD